MKTNTSATIVLLFGLIGYLLMRFTVPALQAERLIFIVVFTVAGLVLTFTHRREKKTQAS